MSETSLKEVVKDRDKSATSNNSTEKTVGSSNEASASCRKGKRDGSFDKSSTNDGKHSERTDSASRYDGGDRYNRDSGKKTASSRGGTTWKNSSSGNFNRGKRDEPPGRRSYSSRYNVSGRGDDHAQSRSRSQNTTGSGNVNNKGNSTHYDDRRGKDSKDSFKNQAEDPVTKLLKRITRNNIERDRRLMAVRQLKELILDPESKAINSTKQVFELIDSLQNVLFERGAKDMKIEVASLVGLLGNFLDHDLPGFFEWVFSHANSTDGDIKVYACSALLEMLKQDASSRKALSYMGNVMANMQHMLEAASISALLTAVLDVILVIAKIYPEVFEPCFREVVDIIIGWLIDPSQGEQLQSTMSKALVSLQPFWTADMEFSAMLLGQFTEDLDIMLGQDLSQALQSGSESSVKTTTDKVTALLRVFYLVMVSLGGSVSSHRGGHITVEYLTQLLHKLVSGVSSIGPEGQTDLIVVLGNDSVHLLLHQLNPESATSVSDVLLPFVVNQTKKTNTPKSNSVTVSLIRLLQKVVELYSTQMPVYFLTELLGPGSALMTNRFSSCPQVMIELMSLYHSVMALKSVPLLEEAYRLVLADMGQCFNVLLKDSGEPAFKLSQGGDNPFKDVVYTPAKAQAAICFNIDALTEIANTKSNLIGMWALSPSIFTLLSQHLMLTSEWMNRHYASVCYSILQAFYSHCQRHSNFVSSSVLVAPKSIPGTRSTHSMSQANSLNLTHILDIVHRLLESPATDFDCRCVLMKWSLNIIDSLTCSSQVYATEEVSNLLVSVIQQGYHQEFQICQCSAQCLRNVFNATTQWKDSIMKSATSLALYRLTDSRKVIRDAFMALLKAIPLDFVIRMPVFEAQEEWMSNNDSKKRQFGLPSVWHLRRSHMARLPAGTFHSHNFRHLMAYILHGTNPSQTGTFHWVEAMYHAKQRHKSSSHQSSSTSSALSDAIDSNESLLWFWATWESAQFAVMSRLRTPLGKAPETFVAIEGVIKSFAAQALASDQLEEEQNDGSKDALKGEKPGELLSLQRVHLLLNFVEHLDKLLYNAYEGCAVAMPMAQKAVKTFFRTNRSTCQEWLSRIRMPLITIALHSGMPAMAVRHASELLRDLDDAGKTEGELFEGAVMYIVKALCQLHAPESVLGIYHWCREVTGKAMDWILAAAETARHRYERAASDFRETIADSFTSKTTSGSGDSNDMDDGEDTEDSHIEMADETGDEMDRSSKKRSKTKKMTTIMTKGRHSDLQTSTYEVISNQVSECYLRLNDWDSVLEWQKWVSQQHVSSNSDSGVFRGLKPLVDTNFIKALQSFDLGDMQGVQDSLELVPGLSLANVGAGPHRLEASALCWGVAGIKELFPRSFLVAQTMMATMTYQEDDPNKRSDVVRVLQHAEKQGEGLMKALASDWPPVCPSSVIASLSCLTAFKKYLDGKGEGLPLHTVPSCSQEVGIDVYHQLTRTVDLLIQWGSGSSQELKTQLSNLRLCAASICRKDGNVSLGEDFMLHEANAYLTPDPNNPSLSSALANIRVLPDQTAQTIRLQREGAKLLRATGKSRSAVEALLGSIVVVSNPLASCPKDLKLEKECTEMSARSLLSVVKWVQADPKLLGTLSNVVSSAAFQASTQGLAQNSSTLAENFGHLFVAEKTVVAQGRSTLILPGTSSLNHASVPDVESLMGKVLHLSCIQCPSLAKAWFSMAAWCYKWGRKAVDSASDGHVTLSDEEKHQILNILPKGLSEEEGESVVSILSQVHNMESGEEDIIDQDQSLYDDGTETTRKQLLSSCPILSLTPDNGRVDRLLAIWRDCVRRLYHFYHLSAKAYFTYLQVTTLADAREGEGDTTVCTLRLLRLLVKHAWELRDVLETGLSQTPTQPWKGIIPQLFSRLSHPESYVRQSISELLCRIGLQSPHLILYPAVVGISNKLQIKIPSHKGLLNELSGEGDGVLPKEEGDDVDEEEAEEGSSPELQACLSAIVDSLSKQNSQMVCEVQLMVQELRRVTLLWEELWLGTLNQHQADVTRRLAQLEAEVKRVEANKSLNLTTKTTVIKEKHLTIMKPTLVTMRHLYEITSQTPQTPQEQWFQSAYGKQITAALHQLEDPTDPSNPHDSWVLFKNIQRSLQSRALKRSSLQLKMDDISPSLASLSHSVIPMPGQGSIYEAVTIEGVHDTAQILPTKTKPKKLIFIGSDGRRHPYLFKGLEDLHLDERIMQFLSIVNTMLYSHKRDKDRQPLYRARHYSVTPLGCRSGLIQWVEGATPLFSLYKKWQHRELTAATLKPSSSTTQNASSASIPPVTSIPRPSEVFYAKLNPALAEKGLEGCDNRKEWPLSVLRQVLEDLMDETPDDLLSRELWCCSSGAGEWWRMTQAYARSTAVMSVIGYIIGLGDRHLDNLLVDLATGEVVHIDYNVCFEKGKGLRVPERVPFRMTPNLETALGLTGVEGTFRMAAEHVLKVMRKGREPLLTLLEAFVYDPLVDWTTGMDTGYTGAFYGGEMGAGAGGGVVDKMKMERDITTSMFSIRLTEMEAAWADNKLGLSSSLPLLGEAVEGWLSAFDAVDQKIKELEDMRAVCLWLEEAVEDMQQKHVIYSLSNRYWEYAMLQAARGQVLASLEEKMVDYSNWTKLHLVSMDKLTGLYLKTLVAEVNSSPTMGMPSFAAASSFLQGAGQTQVLDQCNDLEAEMIDLLERRRVMLQELVSLLHTHISITGQFGGTFVRTSRMSQFSGWLQELLDDFSTNKCEEVLTQFTDHYGLNQDSQVMKAQNVFTVESKLQDSVTDVNTKLIKLLERRSHQEMADTHQLERLVEEAVVAIHLYVYDNGMEGQMSLLCVVVSALYTLNKRYLVMEGAASGAGDSLMDLTSRGGDWFLDELCSMSGNVNQFLTILNSYTQVCEEEKVKALKNCLKATHNVYISLQELNTSFRSIIIPETVKLLQSQDPQLLEIIGQLESLISQSSVPLDELIKQLEVARRNAIMGINKPQQEAILKEVESLQEAFLLLTQANEEGHHHRHRSGNNNSGSHNDSSTSSSSTTSTNNNSSHRRHRSGNNNTGSSNSGSHNDSSTSTSSSSNTNNTSNNTSNNNHHNHHHQQLSAGQMLLLGLTGLFRQLEGELSSMMEWWDVLEVPSVWAKVDTVREARTMQLSTFTASTRPILAAMFFIKRLQAFQSFFRMASHTAKAMLGETTNGLYDDDHLAKPIKKFIADFVHKQVLGFPSQVLGYLICTFLETMGVNVSAEIELKDIGAEWKVPLDSLCKKGLELCQARSTVKSHQLTQVTTLTTTLDSAWRKLDLAKRLDSHVVLLNNQLMRQQPQLTRLQWLHQDLFGQAGRTANTMAEPLRAAVLAQMEKVVQGLLSLEPQVSQCVDRYGQMETNIGQRLRWAAGANPSLHAVINEFEVAIAFRNNFIQEENQRVTDAINLSQALLHMEGLRTHTPESANTDATFVQLVNQCCDVSRMMSASDSTVSDLELSLINLKPLSEGESSDQQWAQDALEVVRSCLLAGENSLEEMHLGLETPQTAIYNVVVDIKALLNTHHKLMSDIRSILKTMAKLEEQEEGEEVREDGVRGYLCQYKAFSEEITSVLKQLVAHDLARDDADACRLKLAEVQAQLDIVYDSLAALAPSIMEKVLATSTTGLGGGGDQPGVVAEGKAVDSLLRSVNTKERESPTPTRGKKDKDKLTRDPKTGKAVQERNSYAVGVWRRVKMKLEGRDPDTNRRMPVAEQVDMVVKEAKNLDNLAVLYEGWTSWV